MVKDRKPFLLLAIESSCDESAAAIIRSSNEGIHVVDQQIASQIDVHQRYGGVVPEIASREHLRNLPLVIDTVLIRAGVSMAAIDYVAVTIGPGLKGCLLIGMGIAQGLALARGVPLVGVNHIEGHLLSPLIEKSQLSFPFLGLIVSGGHTELLRVDGLGDYQVLARTLDDAAGEAFDKSAHMLGFPYPGGAALARLADASTAGSFDIPRLTLENSNFSFSGLKTAVRMVINKNPHLVGDASPERGACAALIQDRIVDSIVRKVERAVSDTGIRSIAVSGGVAANRLLRERLNAIPNVTCAIPSFDLCTDNAAMIGFVAAMRINSEGGVTQTIQVKPRWPVEECGRV